MQPDSVSAVLDGIRRIVQALRQSSRQAELELGLSGAQLFVLRKLADAQQPLTLGALAERTLTHPSSVSTVVTRLVERGFVLRKASPLDRRCIEIKLSAKGRTFLSRSSPVTAQEKLAEAVGRLPPERRVLLADILATVIADAGFAGEEVAMFFEEAVDIGNQAENHEKTSGATHR